MYDKYGNEITWVPNLKESDLPKYQAIAYCLEEDINLGLLVPGQKLPPQRVIADYLGINHSTVTRAYKLCAEKGLIHGTVGRGTYISSYAGIPQHLLTDNLDPTIIEMGMVLPLYETNEKIITFLQDAYQKVDYSSVLQYVPPEGLNKHRYVASKWLRNFKLECPPEQIIITTGSQSALAVILTSLFNKGDRIVADEYTYTGLKSLANLLGIILIPVRTGIDGIDTTELEVACRREKAKGIYLIPDCHNPTTASITPDKRKEIARIIVDGNLLLIEDGTFGFSVPDKVRPISSYIPDNSLFITGVSKMLSTAFRIAYIASPRKYLKQLTHGTNLITRMASALNAELVSLLLNSPSYEQIVADKMEKIKERNRLVDEVLCDYDLVPNENSFFRFLLLPPAMSDDEVERACLARGVQIFSAKRFSVSAESKINAVRLSVSGPRDSGELRKGLQIIREVLESTAVSTQLIL